jgi:hypothetical protein
MRPPAEQLIRDYLNRLSVAARNRLQPEDRRAFLVRTNDYIERQSGVRGTADPAEVMRILSGIGEPETVVERERARIEARRAEREAAAKRVVLWKPRRHGTGQDQARGSEPDVPQLTNNDGRPLTGEIKVTSRPITSRWRPGEALKPPPSRSGRIPKPRPGRSGPSGGTGAATPGPGPGPESAERPPTSAGPGGAAATGSLGPADAARSGAAGTARPGAGDAARSGAGDAARSGAGDGARPGAGDAARSGAGDAARSGAGDAARPGSVGTGRGKPADPAGTAPPAGSAPGLAGPAGLAGSAGSAGLGGPAAASAASHNGVHAGSNGVAPPRQQPQSTRPVLPQAPAPGTAPLAPGPGDGVPAAPRPAGRTVRITPGRSLRISRVARPASTRRRRQRLQPGDVTWSIARRAADVGRRHRLETASVLLMIIVGVIYPYPIWLAGFLIWLVGAGLATMSPVWSLPDKWVGVAGPPALVIIGTATAISVRGKLATAQAYVHEALADSRFLIQIGALLGGGYLLWRLQRGRRAPSVPPWLRRNSR